MSPSPEKSPPPLSSPGDSELDDNKANMLLSAAHGTGALFGWTDNRKATKFFVSMVSCLYFLILTIIALIIELSPTWRDDIWLAETIFFLFMYGVGLIYFVYCYLFMVYPGPINWLLLRLSQHRRLHWLQNWLIIRSNHSGEGAGTLYLRLGALFFGSLATVLFGLEIFLCAESTDCKGSVIAKHVVAMAFTFLQMHFLFCNSKIAIKGSRRISKFGIMHLVSVNLWTWFRFVLAKQVAKANKKKKGYATTPLPDSSSSEEMEASGDIYSVAHGVLVEIANETIEAVLSAEPVTTNAPKAFADVRLIALTQFADLATFLITCVVEYSIIGAAVMFIIWGSIDHEHHAPETPIKRKVKMRMDCSNSSTGLFFGIIFLVAAFVSMGVYSFFYNVSDTNQAALVFGIVDLCLFLIALVACLVGMWRMRLLQYRLHAHGEVIDEILLIIGLIGELVYCTIGIDVFVATRRHKECTDRSLLPVFVFVSRLLQVLVQTAFILTVSRLRCLSPEAMKTKPGKQFITFLWVANITLFVFHTFESMKAFYGINELASPTYMAIIYAVGPLLVFFRFHSSACLAEIWKHTYTIKEHTAPSTPAHFTQSTLTVNTQDETA